MTLGEISAEWAEAASNTDGKELSVRTFHRYREEMASLFGINIECDKADGYRYYIRRDTFANNVITDWMLSSLRIASLGDQLKHHDKVVLERPPENSEYLDDIVDAISKGHLLRFHYRTAYGTDIDMELVPAFVRLFRQRWYVIGALPNSGFAPRTLPFDRISSLEVVDKKITLPTKVRSQLRPDRFFDGCFGIIRQQELPPEPIRIRAFYPENNYIDEVPLHESQTKLCDRGEYCDYELTVRPTRDFAQELLWHGRKIIVLSPDHFRQQMIGVLKDMARSYETGENTLEE